MEDEGQEQEPGLKNDKGERVDELDIMGAGLFLMLQKFFRHIKDIFVPRKVE